MDWIMFRRNRRAPGPANFGNFLVPDEPDEPPCTGEKFLQLQEADNICRAAYGEIMTLAMHANTFVKAIPPLGSIEDIQQMFKTPPSPGMRVDHSVETAIIPLPVPVVISTMMNVDKWASTLSHIVDQASEHELIGTLPQLLANPKRKGYFPANHIQNMKMVNAEFQLPTPFVPKRKFHFVRFLREIIQDKPKQEKIWAIVDLSSDYFLHDSPDSTPAVNCKRRPSGVIIRARENCSEVIWIENVEVPDCKPEDNIYSGIMNSNLAFCAKRWVSSLCKRNEDRFVSHIMPPDVRGSFALKTLLELTGRLKTAYMKCVSEEHDKHKWELLSDQEVKILKDTDALDNNYITALTSFRVQAKPLSVFNVLVKKNMEIQWPTLQDMEEPEEVINLATEDGSYCITLHEREILPVKAAECRRYEYLLQEAWRDEFCSFVVSSPLTKSEVSRALRSGTTSVYLRPSGFSIMPDGSQGLQSDASLVTISLQQELDADLQTDKVIETMSNLITAFVEEISEAVTDGEKHEAPKHEVSEQAASKHGVSEQEASKHGVSEQEASKHGEQEASKQEASKKSLKID